MMKRVVSIVTMIVFAAAILALPWPKIDSVPTAYAQTAFSNCEFSRTTRTFVGTTSGTTAVQIVGLVAGDPIYVCALTVVGISGTTPTFSLVTGTGTNCAGGQAVFLGAIATTANVPFIWPGYFGQTPSGTAICYLDGGTTPVQSYILVVAQG